MSNMVYYYAYDTSSGDYQWGYTYDFNNYNYYSGEFIYSADENGGYWYYYVTDVYSGYSGITSYNYVYSYYDGETGTYATPYYYSNGYATGSNGIGSGYDYVYLGNAYSEFSGYYEADWSPNLVYYYAYDTSSGDYQWGYTYDNGSYGYYSGEFLYSADENGGYWYYYVTDVYSGYSGTSGYNYVYQYL